MPLSTYLLIRKQISMVMKYATKLRPVPMSTPSANHVHAASSQPTDMPVQVREDEPAGNDLISMRSGTGKPTIISSDTQHKTARMNSRTK
ncbi:hypothetical protein BBBOND_0111020 [Babesia bigemina]|uniref:Uncharacterized protein n=1 Tax=Babesia bigemina TaxID=5866 RepID=A0A061D7F3_BABBI|nr:hypothetical protein BBBOND_0111020 [Babesia bigemina]CDR94804.1 hypothetical protein BBBOND_0111020 [Babesia bigemina]|eukprot:XP_012766990.1 hypothetical protein BBBOND_0111020 [Babesia bigemina]